MGQAAIVGILANPAFACVLPTVLSADEMPLTDDEARALSKISGVATSAMPIVTSCR